MKRGKNARRHNHRCIIIIIIIIDKSFGCLGVDLLCSFEFVIMEGKLSLHNTSFDINERCHIVLDGSLACLRRHLLCDFLTLLARVLCE